MHSTLAAAAAVPLHRHGGRSLRPCSTFSLRSCRAGLRPLVRRSGMHHHRHLGRSARRVALACFGSAGTRRASLGQPFNAFFAHHRVQRAVASPTRATAIQASQQARASALPALRACRAFARAAPNPSLNLTRYGRPRLAAPGLVWYCPSAASRVPPTRSG